MGDITWPSVSPVMFQEAEGVYWRDGKPWCAKHHCCVVPAFSVSHDLRTDGGTHVCPRCMRVAYEEVGDRGE